MRVLLVGGSKSGKSMLAQKLVTALADGGTKYYWATMEPVDEEDEARIINHISERAGWGFETIECGSDLRRMLPLDRDACVLFDSVTALAANEMFKDGQIYSDALDKTVNEILLLSSGVKHIVCVCDDVFRDGAEYEALTEEYRRNLSLTLRSLAESFDTVCEVVCGKAIVLKGELPQTEEF